MHCSRVRIRRVGSTPGGAVLEGRCGARHVLRRRRDRHCNEPLGHALVGVVVLVLALPVILCCKDGKARRQYLASKLNLQKGVFDAVRIRFPAPPAGPQAGPHLVLIGPGEVKLAAQVLVEGESHLVPALNGGCDDLPYSCRSKAAPVQQGEPRAQRGRSGAAAGSASAV